MSIEKCITYPKDTDAVTEDDIVEERVLVIEIDGDNVPLVVRLTDDVPEDDLL